MQIKKKADSFNDYTLTLSWGELVAIETALADRHNEPVADELYAGFKYFLDKLPRPGESEDEAPDGKGGKSKPGEDGAVDGLDDADDALAEPPGEGGAMPHGGEGGDEGMGADGGEEAGTEGEEQHAADTGEDREEEGDTADEFLDEPPAPSDSDDE